MNRVNDVVVDFFCGCLVGANWCIFGFIMKSEGKMPPGTEAWYVLGISIFYAWVILKNFGPSALDDSKTPPYGRLITRGIPFLAVILRFFP